MGKNVFKLINFHFSSLNFLLKSKEKKNSNKNLTNTNI